MLPSCVEDVPRDRRRRSRRPWDHRRRWTHATRESPITRGAGHALAHDRQELGRQHADLTGQPGQRHRSSWCSQAGRVADRLIANRRELAGSSPTCDPAEPIAPMARAEPGVQIPRRPGPPSTPRSCPRRSRACRRRRKNPNGRRVDDRALVQRGRRCPALNVGTCVVAGRSTPPCRGRSPAPGSRRAPSPFAFPRVHVPVHRGGDRVELAVGPPRFTSTATR